MTQSEVPSVDPGPTASTRTRSPSDPAVTVLVHDVRDHGTLGRTLDSLVAQTLSPERFEVVVVGAAGPGPRPDPVASARAARPELSIRTLATPCPTRGHRLGALAARGDHVTLLSAGDHVEPGQLAALLAARAHGTVPVSVVQDSTGAPDAASRELVARATEPVRPETVPWLLTTSVGKLVPTRWLTGPVGDQPGSALWLALVARHRFRFAVVPQAAGTGCRPGGDGAGPMGEPYDRVRLLLDEIAALQRTSASHPGVAETGRALELTRARDLNAHLREHPDDHRRLMADVRRRGLIRFPWPSVNRGLARDLAVSYCFPPYQDTSGLVAARRLRERATVTDVLSADVSRLRAVDPGSVAVPAEILGSHRILRGASSFGLWSVAARFAQDVEAAVQELEARQGSYRSLYSRAMPVNSHVAAAVVRIRRPDLPWTAELSDPLKVHPNGLERTSEVTRDEVFEEIAAAVREAGFRVPDGIRLFEFGEVMTYAIADRIVFTNARQRDFMLGYCRDAELADRARRISSVQHHPTLPFDYYTRADVDPGLDPGVVNIGYFGAFYKTRGLSEVTSALAQLAPGVRRRVRLSVFTNRDDHLELEKYATELADVVQVRAFVPFLDYLNLTTCFDVLLVNDADAVRHLGVNPYLPSKLSDYRGSGTPIWAITEPGSVLDSTDTAYSSALGDVAGARRVLEQVVRDHRGALVAR